MNKLEENISNFIRSEGKFQEPSLKSYIQSLNELLNSMEGRSMREARRIEIAKEQLGGIRRQTKRLEEANQLLESKNKELREQLTILEEKENQETLEETNGQY